MKYTKEQLKFINELIYFPESGMYTEDDVVHIFLNDSTIILNLSEYERQSKLNAKFHEEHPDY